MKYENSDIIKELLDRGDLEQENKNIHVPTRDDYEDIVVLLESEGVKWVSGDDPTQFDGWVGGGGLGRVITITTFKGTLEPPEIMIGDLKGAEGPYYTYEDGGLYKPETREEEREIHFMVKKWEDSYNKGEEELSGEVKAVVDSSEISELRFKLDLDDDDEEELTEEDVKINKSPTIYEDLEMNMRDGLKVYVDTKEDYDFVILALEDMGIRWASGGAPNPDGSVIMEMNIETATFMWESLTAYPFTKGVVFQFTHNLYGPVAGRAGMYVSIHAVIAGPQASKEDADLVTQDGRLVSNESEDKEEDSDYEQDSSKDTLHSYADEDVDMESNIYNQLKEDEDEDNESLQFLKTQTVTSFVDSISVGDLLTLENGIGQRANFIVSKTEPESLQLFNGTGYRTLEPHSLLYDDVRIIDYHPNGQ